MKRAVVMVIGALLGLTLLGVSSNARSAKQDIPYPEIPRISLNEAKDLIGKAGVILLDCRPVEQYKDSEDKLPGAIHEDPMEVKSWAEKYPKDATAIIY